VALSRGAGAVVGIAGSFAFPRARRLLGLERTGIWALASQTVCNVMAVASVFLPGSPFAPGAYFAQDGAVNNSTIPIRNTGKEGDDDDDVFAEATANVPKMSIIVFLSAIVLARFGDLFMSHCILHNYKKACNDTGLWMADLTIAQIQQEKIRESERGVVNGVQHATNQIFDMLKDLLVVLLPDPRTFGLLIMVSCGAVASGLLTFVVYARKSMNARKQKALNDVTETSKPLVDNADRNKRPESVL